MGKKTKWGKNSRKEEAVLKKKNKKVEEKLKKDKKQADDYWKETDSKILKKQKKLKEKKEKELKKKLAKLEKKELSKIDEKNIQSKKAKIDYKIKQSLKQDNLKFEQKKKDQLQKKYNSKFSKIVKEKKINGKNIEDKLNKEFGDLYKRGNLEEGEIDVNTIDDFLKEVDTDKTIDKHPEKRIKAKFNKYLDNNLEGLRKSKPGLKLRQYRNLLWKDFMKSDENPMNNKNNFDWTSKKK